MRCLRVSGPVVVGGMSCMRLDGTLRCDIGPVMLASIAQPNKSLDASGTNRPVIDNLSVMWLLAAASTQPLGFFSYAMTIAVERNDILAAFAEVPRPDLKSIHPIGCC